MHVPGLEIENQNFEMKIESQNLSCSFIFSYIIEYLLNQKTIISPDPVFKMKIVPLNRVFDYFTQKSKTKILRIKL